MSGRCRAGALNPLTVPLAGSAELERGPKYGLRDPLVLDASGRLIDGRNRLAACRQAGVEPVFRTEDLSDDDEIEDYILSVNVEKRSLTNGQKAMFRAANLARQGKRKNGRWERGSVDNGGTSVSEGFLRQMKQAGLVIDVGRRASALGPDFAAFSVLNLYSAAAMAAARSSSSSTAV